MLTAVSGNEMKSTTSGMETSYSWLFVVAFILYIYWRSRKRYDYWRKRKVYYLEPTVFFGNTKDMILMRKSDAMVHQNLYNQLRGHSYGGMYHLNRPTLLVRDPELIKEIIVKSFDYFSDRGLPIDPKESPLNAHLFALGGQKWRKLRVKLAPTFTSGKMKAMFPILTECAERMVERLQKYAERKDIIEIKEMIEQMTTDIVGSYAFGLEIDSMNNPDSKFRELGRRAFLPSVRNRIRLFLFRLFPAISPLLRRMKNHDLENFFMRTVDDTIKYREQNNFRRNDFLQLLIQLKNEGKIKSVYTKEDAYLQNSVPSTDSVEDEDGNDLVLTNNLLAAQCYVFFVAGFDPPSSTSGYCLHELAVNPDIQNRLRREVVTVLKEHNGQITYEAVQDMKYMDKVINETLRKYPHIPRIDRVCTKNFTLPGTDIVIEKGISIIMPTYAIHHDPQYYPDPEKFDPERFNEENKASRPQYAYLPFGEGPRICIGMRFGRLQTKVALAALLSKYEFSVCYKTSIPLTFEPATYMLVAKGGINLQITERS